VNGLLKSSARCIAWHPTCDLAMHELEMEMESLMKQLKAIVMCALAAAVLLPAAAWGQSTPRRPIARDTAATVPTQSRPPRGMCRVWIDGVPATQQPAATDCSNAVKNRPQNGRVLFGDDYANRQKAQETKSAPPARGSNTQAPPPATTKRRPPSEI
jgi:hypothetical protein